MNKFLLSAQYPQTRMRRLRANGAVRELITAHHLHASDLIYPIFVEEGLNVRHEVSSLPGVYRETEESLVDAVKEAYGLGIRAVMLFGVSHNKDSHGKDSLKSDGLLARMIDKAKQTAPEIAVIADTCLCEYTDHGHCGPLAECGDVDNDETLEILAKQAVIAAQAGADIIAPSGMMDGMVQAIRSGLDKANYINTPILSYAVKYASHFYGPFRDAAGCALGEDVPSGHPPHNDRKTYQMNPENASEEALQEAALDISEGADMLMVKPGLPYLDIIQQVKDSFAVPVFAYHVSGEFTMLKAAAQNGWLNYENCLMESLISFKRAGCSGIVTYGALDAARLIHQSS